MDVCWWWWCCCCFSVVSAATGTCSVAVTSRDKPDVMQWILADGDCFVTDLQAEEM